ncbi:response regulator [Maribacter stanieri]|uniref:Response regulator receiver domain-containing protein n=1 Tax=Maribacter stanieri TaxID=440514 RepID=A0A1I6IMV2_9FLAO|nr:response regulator [Maribacter stanieri]SFR68052.1 Response regulator receiver domain-containing protein [Maribacter stanieri]
MIQNPLVWIIDDDDISKYVMKRYLKQLSITKIVDFPDSIKPLTLLNENLDSLDKLPDTIFLDLHMPILNGFDFLKEFQEIAKNIDKKIDIIMLTSSINSEDLDHAKSFPEITDYFIKPIKHRDLARIMSTVV